MHKRTACPACLIALHGHLLRFRALQVRGAFCIWDVGSSSGTFLNGKRLSDPKMPSPMSVLVPGDVIQLGVSLTEDNQPVPDGQDDHLPIDRRAIRLRVLFLEKAALYLSANIDLSSSNPLEEP